MRPTILFLGAIMVMLVVASSVAFGFTQCTEGACYGTNARDDIYGSVENDQIYGYGGGDSINAGRGSDYIDGGSGVDVIEGDGGYGAGNDKLVGGAGDDLIDGGPGNNDRCDGGNGFDKATAECEFKVRIEGKWVN